MSAMKRLICAAGSVWVFCVAGSWIGAPSVWNGIEPAVAQAADPAGRAQGQRPQPSARRQQLLEYLRQPNLTPEQRTHQMDMVRQNESEEWSSFMDFFKNVSPNRYRLMQLRPPLPGAAVRLTLMQRWLNLQQFKETQPALYGLHVEQFRVEDEIVGLAAQYRVATRRGNVTQAANARAQIKTQADKLVDLNLAERTAQIEYARKLLDDQETGLAADKANTAQLYAQREGTILQESQIGGGGLMQNRGAAPGDSGGASAEPPIDTTTLPPASQP